MKCILSLMIFIIGSCLGSFYGCMGYRIPNKINTIKPGSFCANCKKPLKWYMNIPLFSYIFLKGKCYYCKKKIGISNFLLELFTGLTFLLFYNMCGFTMNFFVLVVLVSVLAVTLISDICYYYISDRVIALGILSIYIIHFIFEKSNFKLLEFTITGIVMFVSMLCIKLLGDKIFKKESLGGGDIKLMGLMGLTLGSIITSFISLFISSLLALVYSLFNRKNNIIPFGPFLIIGTIITYIVYAVYGFDFMLI